MRVELKKIGSDKRHTFLAEVGRDGEKSGWNGEIVITILLKNIRLKKTGQIVANHLWFTKGIQFEDSECEEGDEIEFSARVAEYGKGWQGRKAEEIGEDSFKTDWKLERPSKIKVVSKEVRI